MNKNIVLIFILFTIIFASCASEETSNKPPVVTPSISIPKDTIVPKKEFGDRYSIVGDFNGDKISDTVYESYISSLTHKETYKILDDQDWENNMDLIVKNSPVTRLYTTIPNVDTFLVTMQDQQSGLFHYRNLGDINNDGKDEIGYAIKWLDYSNLNTYHVITLQGNKFEELFHFKINESFLYDNQEGLFDNGELIQQKDKNTILYKFQSDSATIETGEYKMN